MDLAEARENIKKAADYLQDHRRDTSLSGHFDMVPGDFADDVSKAVEIVLKELDREI